MSDCHCKYVHTRGNKIESKSLIGNDVVGRDVTKLGTDEGVAEFYTTAFRNESEFVVDDGNLEANIMEHEGLVRVLNVDMFLELSRDSFGESSTTVPLYVIF